MTTTQPVSRIDARSRRDGSNRRLARVLAAISATNEAILRSTTVEEMLQKVATAAVEGGGFLGAAIYRKDDASASLHMEAAAGSFI